MIDIKNVTKSFGNDESRFSVLKDISLKIADGEFAVILGPSGSGKSTLLSIISGLERPDSGSIVYDNVDIAKFPDKELTQFRKDNIGFIFQQYFLLSNLTVSKNVKMGADLADNGDYMQIVEAVGLGGKVDKYPSELSGGEQQRVSIARALAKKPKILFLDEPTGALDEETGRSILDYISKLQEQLHFSIVMVTHNANIADMANTVIKMNSGRIAEILSNAQPKGAFGIGW